MNERTSLTARHSSHWRQNRWVYPVISRRCRGLSIGVNLNPDQACNFDCVYCQVDRTTTPTTPEVILNGLRAELGALLKEWPKLFVEPEFVGVAPELRRLNDVAFSGDGEPTAVPIFPEAAEVVADLRREFGLTGLKIITITNACFLTRPAVAATLARLDDNGGEIWAKLDAGTQEHFQRVNRAACALDHVLANILSAARIRPIVIQSLFLRQGGTPPSPVELDAWADRLSALRRDGAQIKLVQVYSTARRTAEADVTSLSAAELRAIAERVRAIGLSVEWYE